MLTGQPSGALTGEPTELVAGLAAGAFAGSPPTERHRELARTARTMFTPDRLAGWRDGPDGPLTARAWRDLARHGLLGVPLAAELGGRGLGMLGSLVLSEAMAPLGDAGIMLAMHVHNDVATQWLADADPALRDRYLPGLLDGTLSACQADTDPSADEPATACRTGGHVVLRGAKQYVINGAGAGLCFVSARLDGERALVLVPKQTPGVSVAHVYDKFGTRSADSARIEFDDVRVPADHVLSRGGVGQLLRWNRVMSRMRYLIAFDAYLIHRRLLDHAVRHVTHRRLGGRLLGDWPATAHPLARARADEELMAAGIAALAGRVDGPSAPVPEVAELKWFCVERACDLARLCCDLEGGAGYMWDSPSLRAYAQLRGLRMAGGSQTTMLTLANHSFASRAELDGLGEAGTRRRPAPTGGSGRGRDHA
ncbi:acyl-CoA dehydrogenase family protein [Actinoallomurus sp. NPDC050550]|uniref:acyl-CoA dehydrogenase family protein n=1 Tax=Actinoallomurus sp. NPDC050550 TaxID=3154937 RepID=UPI0033F7F321